MAIDYVLADRKRQVVFGLGTHKHVFARMLRRALEEPPPPARHDYVLACVAEEHDLHLHYPGSVASPLDEWLAWIAECAERIWDFAETAGWDVELCNDCDDSLVGKESWPEVATIYKATS